MCDVAHAILMDRVERAALAQYQAALIRGIDPPFVEDARRSFDDELNAEPVAGPHIDPGQMALRRALGVA